MPKTRKKKSFRDVAKLGSTHFEVGFKNQRDPNPLANSEASEHVLMPKDSSTRLERWQLKEEEEEGNDGASVSVASTTASRLQIPSSVLGSVVERVELMNMAAESAGLFKEFDPETAAALDDNFDFEDPNNFFEDDFIINMANVEGGPETIDKEEGDEETDNADEDEDEKDKGGADEKTKDLTKWLYQMQLQRQGDGDEEDSNVDHEEEDDDDDDSDKRAECSEDTQGDTPRVSKFSANMVPRNENLRLLDKMTQALLEREYSWDKMGALDGEELSGRVKFDSDLFRQAEQEMLNRGTKVTMKELFNAPERVRPEVPEAWYYVEEKDFSKEEVVDCGHQPLAVKKKPDFDAQSILSTYSRSQNMPTKIQIPEEWMPKKKQNKEETDDDSASVSLRGLSWPEVREDMRQSRLERMADAAPTYRPKDETKEERRERKQAVKAQKKERRTEKKMCRLAQQNDDQHKKKVQEDSDAQKRVISLRA
ncbi:hypothetical protein ACOMHN_011700 [Nucella lapillus]